MFKGKPVEIRTAPHLKRPQSVDEIMRNVVYALLPVAGFSVWQFGLSSLALLLTTILCECALFNSLISSSSSLLVWEEEGPTKLPEAMSRCLLFLFLSLGLRVKSLIMII